MKCPQCQATVPDGATLCPRCRTHMPGDGLWSRLQRWLGIRISVNADVDKSFTVTRTTQVVTTGIKVKNPGTGEVREYDSLDALPPEIRQRIQEVRQQALAGGTGMTTSTRITVTDQQGKTRTFNSPDEMPPDLRDFYLKAQRRAQSGGGT
ncbi:MAG: hypothetical protein A3K19_26260 [Lentisphaerae bacterium RIFOXYB12_FULL_65_16]|nr:MAG: hypothetical protein A3K18_29725 [Lentisphaerae bacterium RIFOXYA12_64_32]OGV87778.1 MAG: hypothetical protein A3K19_26260 [Lentisphaerae bacterium RIFOXYB12_FULL_65_16]